MENQHRQITGYRELGVKEIALMNEIKAQGEALQHLVFRLRNMSLDEINGCPVDLRWVSIGATDLQTGLMALTRSVAQQTTF
jgi:hypothetical protein